MRLREKAQAAKGSAGIPASVSGTFRKMSASQGEHEECSFHGSCEWKETAGMDGRLRYRLRDGKDRDRVVTGRMRKCAVKFNRSRDQRISLEWTTDFMSHMRHKIGLLVFRDVSR